ncbi:MgtC/SapB family protein [Peptoniphilus sp. oral taxon 386]|uniref:MgtC/SapB family protein n=1 Tax=Peptoniphilus sp. oral taxon 386 TaxID=652713 RepID=UPI0001DA9DE1|nr:MgtC/SapB family protein [Peptoniphilus sp. oral taxon 386]EFI41444.1 Mg2+ transporter-C family protein [Peptoniphilus sp. oral taxon 386 str. F0131]
MTFELYFNIDLFLRVIVSCLCGLVIGYERENRNKFAGVRTHIIVALGSCLGMIISKYGFSDVSGFDPSRIASQVVSGIGFLGAGVIFVKNNSISGLTTAAGIWTTSIIGMTFGSGLYIMGLLGTFLIVIIQFLLYRNEYFKFKRKIYTVVVDCNSAEVIKNLRMYLSVNSIDYKALNIGYADDSFKITLKYLSRNENESDEFMKFLGSESEIVKFKFL